MNSARRATELALIPIKAAPPRPAMPAPDCGPGGPTRCGEPGSQGSIRPTQRA